MRRKLKRRAYCDTSKVVDKNCGYSIRKFIVLSRMFVIQQIVFRHLAVRIGLPGVIYACKLPFCFE